MYYGEWTDVKTLAVNTRFWVHNGCWYGRVRDNGIYIEETCEVVPFSDDNVLNITICLNESMIELAEGRVTRRSLPY